MSSGNFEIGEGLSLRAFSEYLKPSFEKYNSHVTDIIEYNIHQSKKLLVSLVCCTSPLELEKVVKLSLDDACIKIERINKDLKESERLAWPHQVKNYEGQICAPIGLFQEDETASKVFQFLAIKYSAKGISEILEEAKSEIIRFGEKFSKF